PLKMEETPGIMHSHLNLSLRSIGRLADSILTLCQSLNTYCLQNSSHSSRATASKKNKNKMKKTSKRKSSANSGSSGAEDEDDEEEDLGAASDDDFYKPTTTAQLPSAPHKKVSMSVSRDGD